MGELSKQYLYRMSSPAGKGGIHSEIETYGKICQLEGEIEMLENFYNIRSAAGVKTTIGDKKQQLQNIKSSNNL